MKLDAIVIGDRVRKDMGDLRGLAASITRHGLLHPVVVKKDGTLVAGHRRIEAARLLGLDDLAATVIDVDDLLSAERDENTERKDWTPTEAVAIGRLIEDQHRPKIEATRSEMARKGSALRDSRRAGIPMSKEQAGPPALGSVRSAAAQAVGMSEATYHRAKTVVAAAEAEPEKFGDLPARMDESGNVAGAHRDLENRRKGTNGRHAIHYKKRTPKTDDMIQRAVNALEGIRAGLEEIKPEEANAKEAPAWAASIEESAGALRKFARRLKR